MKISSSISFMGLIVIISFLSSSSPAYGDNLVDFILQERSYLSLSYYHKDCPDLDKIIHLKVNEWVNNDSTIATSLIRLHFHDCAVRIGHDSNTLHNPIGPKIVFYSSTFAISIGSERAAAASKSLRGFQLIDDIKAEVEKKCPKTVSCADILTAAARDAARKVGVPFWEVPYGRKDGKVSIAKEADEQVPTGREDITTLIEFFQARGMNLLDLVVLSGAHTMGRTTCGVIQHRLYNFKGTHKTDPSIDEKYANFLKRKCRWQSEYVDLDATTPHIFDAVYYKNLQKKMGLLSSDQLLYSDPRTAPLVNALASQPDLFMQQFVVSMVKLGNTQVLTGRHEGEIRTKCSSVNSANTNQKKY